jgi:hypothetical protein
LCGGREATNVVSLLLKIRARKSQRMADTPGVALLRTHDDLRGEPEHLAVDRSARQGRHVVALGNERARDDDVEAGLAAALRGWPEPRLTLVPVEYVLDRARTASAEGRRE